MSFFNDLKNTVDRLGNQRIPFRAREGLNSEQYFLKWAKTETKIVKETDWASFFQVCTFLTYPTPQDTQQIKIIDTEDLKEFHIIIFKGLLGFASMDLQDSTECKMLHAHYKLTRSELEHRKVFQLHGDAFEFAVQNKAEIEKETETMEYARKTGDFCPYCDSKNVRSYNKLEWKCYDCGKRFRKHF